MSENIIRIIAGLLGVVFLTLSRMDTFRKDATVANVVFDYKKFFQKDGLAIGISVLSVFIWFILSPEAINNYPSITNWIRFSFFASGVLGAWVLQKALGNTKSWLRNIVDKKTDIADKHTESLNTQ